MSGLELEVKAVVDDPEALQRRLEECGAVPGFRGVMTDRRFDLPGAALLARDQVLRVRTFRSGALSRAEPAAQVAWKGPTARGGGYKEREELQVETRDAATAEEILRRLGYGVTDVIERTVAYYEIADAVLRLEWYPRMDALIEVEGEPEAIERAAVLTGIPRAAFTSDRLIEFAARYEARTGRKAALALATLEPGEQPGFPAWGR